MVVGAEPVSLRSPATITLGIAPRLGRTSTHGPVSVLVPAGSQMVWNYGSSYTF